MLLEGLTHVKATVEAHSSARRTTTRGFCRELFLGALAVAGRTNTEFMLTPKYYEDGSTKLYSVYDTEQFHSMSNMSLDVDT